MRRQKGVSNTSRKITRNFLAIALPQEWSIVGNHRWICSIQFLLFFRLVNPFGPKSQ